MATAATLSLAAVSCSKDSDSTATDNAPIIGRTEIAAEHLTPELLQELGKISDLQASPDGTQLLYGVGYTSVKLDKSNRELFVMDLADNQVRQITKTPRSEQNAVWSLDGKKIYFLSPESGSMQMWQMNADGSARQQISDLDRDIEGFLLSPDQQQVLLIMAIDVPRIDSTLFEGLDKTTGRLWDDMNYRHWDDFVNNYPHPYLARLQDGKVSSAVTDIMQGEPYECPMRPFGGIEAFAWSPSGSHIVYCTRKEVGTRYAFSTRSSVYLYDLVSGQTVDLHPGDHGYDTNPKFSPDGRYLAFQAMARNGYESDKNALCIIDLDGFPLGNEGDWNKVNDYAGNIKDLTANYDNNCDDYVWTPDGQALTFLSYSYGTAQVFGIDLEGNVRQLSDGSDHDFGGLCYCGNQLLTLRHDWHSPNEIFALDTTTGTATQLSHENDDLLAQLGDMGRFERRWMKCTNGDSMLVWIAYPVGFDETLKQDPDHKFPTLLYCQGGPESAVSQFWSTRWNIAIMQANGYAIVLPNRHGVPGFGQKFNEQIAGDFAGQCMRDYFTAIDNVAKESWCDASRLGAVGASFGGYSVYWLAGHHQDRFKCFIAHCGIFNCESMYGETEEMWFADWDYGGSYFGQGQLDKDLCHTPVRGNGSINSCYTDSPHKSITKWNTPILVIHNEHDYRIPVTQGMQAFNLARMRGIDAQFLYFPDECHWVTHPQNAVLWQRVYFNWLDKYLKK